MILLSGHSRTPARKVPLEALSLSLKERDSTATMTPADMSGIGLDSWFLDDTNPGAGIIWRVSSIQTAFATDTPTVQLEHIISTLKDRILFGEVTPEDISGGSTCTAEQAVRYILRQQSDWRLGNFGFNVSGPYKFNGDSLFDAIAHVTESLDGAWWSYDLSSYPFTLHIMPKVTGVACEMRPGRNLNTVTKTIDKSSMYTRFYPIGKDDLHISGNYVSRNENLYGVISKVEVDQGRETEADLRAWANERLRKHADPVVTIAVEGMELADATGESIDRLTLGRICRIPLTEYGTTIEEYITEIRYKDKVHNPERVTVTLCNKQDDVRMDIATVIAEAIKAGGSGGGRGGRANAKQQKEDHAWFEDTDDHVAMCAVGIIGKDAHGNPNWYRLSRLEVGEYGIYGEVQSVQNDVVVANTRIDQTENHITLEANRAVNAENALSGKITVQADRITQEVAQRKNGDDVLSGKITVEANRITQEVTNRQNADSTLSGRITVEAGRINQIVSNVGADGTVTAASICLAVNSAGSSATINADKIYLLGQTIANQITADYISTKIASIPTLRGIAASFSGNVSASGGLFGQVYVGSGTSYTNISDGLSEVKIDGPTNNTYKLQYKKFSDSSWQDAGTFSRATTLSGAWSSGVFTVSASPQGASKLTSLTVGGHWGNSADQEDTKHYYGEIKATIDSGATLYDTGKTFEIDASSIYTAGQNSTSLATTYDSSAGKYKVYIVNHATESMYVTYTNSQDASDGGRTITVKLGSTTVKSDSFNDYKSGWNDSVDACTEVTRYTRSNPGSWGGGNYTHYVSYQGQWKDVGTGWYQTTQANAYERPAKK